MWNPSDSQLQEVILLLIDSSSPDSKIQKSVCKRLNEYENFTDFYLYLLYIITKLRKEIDANVIYIALSILKNNLKKIYNRLDGEIRTEIKKTLGELMEDDNAMFQKLCGNIIVDIAGEDLQYALEVLPKLSSLIKNNSSRVGPLFETLEKICVEVSDRAQPRALGQKTVITRILEFLLNLLNGNSFDHIKAYWVVRCTQKFIVNHSDEILDDSLGYLKILKSLLSLNIPSLSLAVCSDLTLISEVSFQNLRPHLKTIIPQIIDLTCFQNYELCLRALEFWGTFLEQSGVKEILSEYLIQLVNRIMPCLVYSEHDGVYITYKDNQGTDEENVDPTRKAYHPLDDDDSDMDDSIDPNEWTMRKAAAHSLDRLAQVFGSEICQHLEHINSMLSSNNWCQQEAALLAIGAISKGCMMSCDTYFPQLFPHLIMFLNHNAVLVRSISCWTLSRYAQFYADNPIYIERVVLSIFDCMADSNKLVQNGAISGLSCLLELCNDKMGQFCDIFAEKLIFCLGIYKEHNMNNLYDFIARLAHLLPGFDSHPIFVNQILPSMISKLVTNHSEYTFSDLALLDSISYLTLSLKEKLFPYCDSLVEFCIQVVEQGVNQIIASEQDCNISFPDKDYIITCLDLLSCFSENVGPSLRICLAKYDVPNFLGFCYRCNDNDVRVSSIGCIGAIVGHFFDLFEKNIPNFMNILLDFQESDSSYLINNRMFSLKVFFARLGPQSSNYAQRFLEKVCYLFSCKQVNSKGADHLIYIFSYLTKYCPSHMLMFITEITPMWCVFLIRTKDVKAKREGSISLCILMPNEPAVFLKSADLIYQVLSSFEKADQILKSYFLQMMASLNTKISISDFQNITSQLPLVIRDKLHSLYGL